MNMRICFDLSNRRVCIELPVLLPQFPPHRPQPDPWGKQALLSPQVHRDLWLLAAAEQVTHEMSSPIARTVQASLHAAAKQLELPAGVSVEFEPAIERAA